jgi:hypothetical protein
VDAVEAGGHRAVGDFADTAFAIRAIDAFDPVVAVRAHVTAAVHARLVAVAQPVVALGGGA